ncbi:MAG: hypothetical protein HY078_02635 [Elusimicrobia bacterium]|nr:hypothetical protein [Elusimicrobiota bacterium]
MKRRAFLAAAIAVACCGLLSAEDLAVLRFEPACIFSAVAKHHRVDRRPEIPEPRLLLSSRTTIQEYHRLLGDAPFKPPVVQNTFLPKHNIILLNDAASLYGKFGRTLDDVAAHEYVHYLQVFYTYSREYTMGLITGGEDFLEDEAVRTQFWFRDQVAAGADVCAGR